MASEQAAVIEQGRTRVERWSRWGRDRLYVSGEQGEPLGHVDMRTGRGHGVVVTRSPEFWEAVNRWATAHPHPPIPGRTPPLTSARSTTTPPSTRTATPPAPARGPGHLRAVPDLTTTPDTGPPTPATLVTNSDQTRRTWTTSMPPQVVSAGADRTPLGRRVRDRLAVWLGLRTDHRAGRTDNAGE